MKSDFQENLESLGSLVFQVKTASTGFLETMAPWGRGGSAEPTVSPASLDPRATTGRRDHEDLLEREGRRVLEDNPVPTEYEENEESQGRGDQTARWGPKVKRATRGRLEREDCLEFQGMLLMLSLSLENLELLERKERKETKENQENWAPEVYPVSRVLKDNLGCRVRRATMAPQESRGVLETLGPPAWQALRGHAGYQAMWASRASSGLLGQLDSEERREKLENQERQGPKAQRETPVPSANPDQRGRGKTGNPENQEHKESKAPQAPRVYRGLKENLDYQGTGAKLETAKWDRREFQGRLVNLELRV